MDTVAPPTMPESSRTPVPWKRPNCLPHRAPRTGAPAGLRLPVAGRILGVDAGLDGVPWAAGGCASSRSPSATRKLEFDEVQAGGQPR
jgi:hypothetical protein